MRKRPRPGRIASILRDFQADLDSGLNIDQACRKAGSDPPPTTAGRPSGRTPYRVNNFAYPNSRPRSDRLKLLVAELMLDKRMLQEASEKN